MADGWKALRERIEQLGRMNTIYSEGKWNDWKPGDPPKHDHYTPERRGRSTTSFRICQKGTRLFPRERGECDGSGEQHAIARQRFQRQRFSHPETSTIDTGASRVNGTITPGYAPKRSAETSWKPASGAGDAVV